MVSTANTANTGGNAKFPTACSSCQAPQNGFVIRQDLLCPSEISGELLAGRASERTVRHWMRDWCPSGRLPGRRTPVVVARDFVMAFEAHKMPSGPKPTANPRRAARLETKCSACHAALGGFVAPLALRGLQEILPEIGGGFMADVLLGWIRRGLLRAYRIEGIRGPVFDPREFAEDFARLRRQYLQPRVPATTPNSARRTTDEPAST